MRNHGLLAIARMVLFTSLLLLEVGLFIGFFILPQLQISEAPPGHWEKENPFYGHPGLWAALAAFLAFVTFANIGLVIMLRRSFNEFKANRNN